MMAEYSQTYWNELIEQYRSGSISAQDRFQLEKQALDDPFLFDALEGFSLQENAVEEVTTEKTSSKIFTLPRIAAAASIILLVAFLFNLKMNSNSQPEKNNPIAMVLDEEIPSEGANENSTSDLKSVGSNKSELDAAVEAETVFANNSNPSTSTKDKDVETATYNKAVKETIPQATSIPTNDLVEAEVETIEDSNDDVIADARAKTKATNEGIPSTQVNDELIDEVADVSNAASLENEAEDQVEEIVVPVAAGSNLEKELSKKKKRSEISSVYKAVPVIGKEIFDDYAKERIDKRGLRHDKPQEVTIEFTIDKNGNLSDFHHIFTGCPECGPFAISVLQNSGEWKTVPPGFSGKARYTFIF